MADNPLLTPSQERVFGKGYIELIVSELNAAGKTASGKLIRSLNYTLRETADDINFIFVAEDYFQNIDQGRRPGSYPPIKDIIKWTRVKGISPNAAYPIARSIYRFGIKPTNVLEKADRKAFNGAVFNKLENDIAGNTEKVVAEVIGQLNNKK